MAEIGEDGMDIQYQHRPVEGNAEQMYLLFVDALRTIAHELVNCHVATSGVANSDDSDFGKGSFLRELVLGPADTPGASKGPKTLSIVAGDFNNSALLEVKSTGPFM